jgi:hypothetical protein
MPTITADDLFNLIRPTKWSLGVLAAEKVTQLAQVYTWYTFCQCISGGTPAAPAGPAAPSGAPQLNPPAYVTAPNAPAPCQRNVGASYNDPSACGTGGCTLLADPFNAGITPTTVSFRGRRVAAGASHPAASARITWLKDLTTLSTELWNFPYGDTTFDRPVPPTATSFRFEAVYGGTSTDLWGAQYEVYCGPPPGQASFSQCGPDARTLGLLEQIWNLVQLIQRQAAPFSYVLGTQYAGLTGRGQLPIEGCIGVKVELASIPNWAGVAVGDPDTLWLDSWINWGNSDGWLPREFLRAAPHLSFPPLPGQYDTIGWSLADGLSVTITELIREP